MQVITEIADFYRSTISGFNLFLTEVLRTEDTVSKYVYQGKKFSVVERADGTGIVLPL